MKKTVIYGLFCPLEGAVRYIGKSSDVAKRFAMHQYSAPSKKSHKDRWISKLAEAGLKPSLVILAEVQQGETWQEVERFWIAKGLADGWPLTNMSSGGDGSSPIDLAARAMRFMLMGRQETRQKMSDSAKARWADPEKRARGVHGLANEQRRQLQSELAKKRATPEYREMMRQRTTEAWKSKRANMLAGITDETRAKVSAAARKMWAEADEEKKTRMLSNLEASQ